MKINKIIPTILNRNSQKQRFINDEIRASIESLLIRMNAEVLRVVDGDHFRTTITTKLKYGNAFFEDERRLKNKVPFKEQMQGFSYLRLSKKTSLDIDNKSGEIIYYKKPFYKPWFYVLKQASDLLEELRGKFYDTKSVKKETITLHDLTPEGTKRMQKYVLNIEKQRLEDTVKNLEEISK